MPRFVPSASSALLALALATSAAAQSSDGTFGSDQRFLSRDGAVLYRSVCQGCHMPEGQGAVGAGKYPALVKNQNLEAGGYPVFVVVNGLRGMPPFGKYLDDAQVAAVVDYVRTHFGNEYRDKISPDDVKAVR
jgi:mono/diheme cytochrome c family protein